LLAERGIVGQVDPFVVTRRVDGGEYGEHIRIGIELNSVGAVQPGQAAQADSGENKESLQDVSVILSVPASGAYSPAIQTRLKTS
jgi:hypothetical protein